MISASIISIGTELLNGKTINSNATYMGKRLNDIGIPTKRCLMIPDTSEDIINALQLCEKDSQIILLSGGLGPTNDDITKYTLNTYFNGTIQRSESELSRLEHMFSKRGYTLTDINKAQADYPDVCDILVNTQGTASGMHFEKDSVHYYCTPGVPYEMRYLMDHEILPDAIKRLSISKTFETYTYRTCAIGESHMYERLEDIITENPSLEFAFYPHFMLVDLKVKGEPHLLKKFDAEIERRIQDHLYSKDESVSLPMAIADKLVKAKHTLATAESCTGGLISNKLTHASGVSACLKGGVVAYSNEIKETKLDVPSELIATHGAVSSECVIAMAEGVKRSFNTDYAISVSGIAGPLGGTPEKPVGTVWFGISTPQETVSFTRNLGNERQLIQERAASYALWLLYSHIKNI